MRVDIRWLGTRGGRIVVLLAALLAVRLFLGSYVLVDDDIDHLIFGARKGFWDYLCFHSFMPNAHTFRPLTFLCYRVVWHGIAQSPELVHWLSLLWVGAAALGVAKVVELLWGDSLGATAAGALFMLFPTQCEVLASSATLCDPVAAACMVWALAAEFGGARPWVGPLLFGLSMLGKESGLLLIPCLAGWSWLHGGRARSWWSALGRYSAVFAAGLALRLAVMGCLWGYPMAVPPGERIVNTINRLYIIFIDPLKAATSFLPHPLAAGLFALAVGGALWRGRRRLCGRQGLLLGAGLLLALLPASHLAQHGEIQDARLMTMALPFAVIALAAGGTGPTSLVLLAALLPLAGNLQAHREAWRIHEATAREIRHHARTYVGLLWVQGLPAIYRGVKLYYGSTAFAGRLYRPEAPATLVALPDPKFFPGASRLADQALEPFFAMAAAGRIQILRLVYQAEAGRPVVRDEVILQPGQSLVPGSSRSVPPLPPASRPGGE